MPSLETYQRRFGQDAGWILFRHPGCAHVADGDGVWHLHLRHDPAVGDVDAEVLARIPSLRELILDGTGVTDRGAEALARSTSLVSLHLAQTRVTDHGLSALKRIPTLREIGVAGTPVSDGGRRAFRRARPDCLVDGVRAGIDSPDSEVEDQAEVPRTPEGSLAVAGFLVIVADNNHPREPGVRHRSFDSYEAALDECRAIVDGWLTRALQSGISGEALLQEYRTFGEDPFILPVPDGREGFSAWSYARDRCRELLGDPPSA